MKQEAMIECSHVDQVTMQFEMEEKNVFFYIWHNHNSIIAM